MRSRLRFLLLGLILLLVMGTQVPLGRTAGVSYCAGQVVTIEGTSGDDVLDGTAGSDVTAGFGGDDLVRGLGGGDGRDTASFRDSSAPVQVDLGTGVASGYGDDILTAIEKLVGSHYSDLLVGDSESNEIDGGFGHDQIFGGADTDVLKGSAGNDFTDGQGGFDCAHGGLGTDH